MEMMNKTQQMLNKLYGKNGSYVDIAELSMNVNSNDKVANEYLQKISNMLIYQDTVDTLMGIESHPIIKYLLGQYTPDVADGTQIMENQVIPTIDYDKNVILPSKPEVANTLSAFCRTMEKKIIEESISLDVVKRAFTSLSHFDKFVANYKGQIEKSYYLAIYNLAQKYLLGNVPLSFYFDGTKATATDEYSGLQQAVQEFSNLMEQATGVPTNLFNMDGRCRKINHTEGWNDFLLIVSPKTLNDLVTKNLPKLFNEKFLEITGGKFEKVIKSNLVTDNTLYVIHTKSFSLLKRLVKLENQLFPKNLSIYYFLHFWLIPQFIPWSQSFKFVYDTKDDKNTIIGGYPTTATVVAHGDNMDLTKIVMNIIWNTTKTGDLVPTLEDYIAVRVIDSVGEVMSETIWNSTGTAGGAQWVYTADPNAKYLQFPTISANTSVPLPIADVIDVPKGEYTIQVFSYFKEVRSSSSSYVLDATKPSKPVGK